MLWTYVLKYFWSNPDARDVVNFSNPKVFPPMFALLKALTMFLLEKKEMVIQV